MCYPNDRTKADHQTQKNDFAQTKDVKWGRSMVSSKSRISNIGKLENYTLKLKLPEGKETIIKKCLGNDENIYLKVAGKVKELDHDAIKSVFRLRKKEINPTNTDSNPNQLVRRLKRIMDSFKIKGIPSTTMYNWGYPNKFKQLSYFTWDSPPRAESFLTSGLPLSLFENTRRTIPPKKLRLLKALLKRFRTKTTTDSSMVLNKLAEHPAMFTTTSRSRTKGSHRMNDQFLSLKEFDHIFTPSTDKYNDGVPDVEEDERFYLRNGSFYLDYDSSIADDINQITESYKSITENYKSKLSNACSNGHRKVIIGTSLNSLVEKNLTKFLTKLKNSDHKILPATPITLTINEDNDDILISNNTMILPIPIIGKYVRKDFKKSNRSDSGPITNGDRKSHFNMSDIKTLKEGFYALNNYSLIPYILRGSKLMHTDLNAPVFSIVTNITETPSREDHKSKLMTRPVIKKNDRKNISVIKVFNNYNSSDQNVAKMLHSANTKPALRFKVPLQDYLHYNSEILKTFQDIDSTSLSRFSDLKTIQIPNFKIRLTDDISPPHNRSNEKIRKIWGNNKIFSGNLRSRLNGNKQSWNGTDEFLSFPLEVFSNEYIVQPTNITGLKEDKCVKDHLFSGQIKMNQEKYVYDREDCCDTCNAKHTVRPQGHHKSLSTRIGKHIESKHVTEYYKCPKCASTDETENTYQEDSYTYEDVMPESFQTDMQSWKCTCQKISKERDRVRHGQKWSHINHRVKTPVSTSTGEGCTLKIYDEDEADEDYLIDSTESNVCEKHLKSDKFENSEQLNVVTHKPVDGQRGCYMTTCSCKRKNPTITGPSRQDIIVSLLCGGENCTRCTKCTTDDEEDSLSFNPKKLKTNFHLDEIQKGTTCRPLEVTAPLPNDGWTICTKHHIPSVITHPARLYPTPTVTVACPYCLKTKKRRCTCACFCGSKTLHSEKKLALFSTKPRRRGTKKMDFLDIFPYLDQNPLPLKPKDVETTSLSNKKSTHQFLKVIHASHVGTCSSTDIETMGTYYTVTDIDLTHIFSKMIFYEASNETENKDETDSDYWMLGSTSDENISFMTDIENLESSTETECDLNVTSEQDYETTCSNVKSTTVRRLCFCSRNKVKNFKNKHHDSLEERQDGCNRIKSKNVGKYKTYGLDSLEMTDGLNRYTPIVENTDPRYKEVTWIDQDTKKSHWLDDDIESMTPGYAEMDHYRTQTKPSLDDDSSAFKIITQDYDEFIIPSNVTTPHSLLSPRERLTLSTKRVRIPSHHEIRAFLTSNSLRKSRVKSKNKKFKALAFSTNPVNFLNGIEKSHAPHKTGLSTAHFFKRAKQRSNSINQASYEANFNPSGEKPADISRVITKEMESDASMESEPISLPKEIVKSSEIASVKIVFGKNHRNVKKKKKGSFNGTKKFFSFETEL